VYKLLRKKCVVATDLDQQIGVWRCVTTQLASWRTAILEKGPRYPALATDAQHELTVFTDASPKGWGAVAIRQAVFSTSCGYFVFKEHINILEARAAKEGVKMIAREFTNNTTSLSTKKVTFFVDNEAFRNAVINRRSANFAMNQIIQEIISISSTLPIIIQWQRIPSAANIADILTRL
jgi:hypothetical protein